MIERGFGFEPRFGFYDAPQPYQWYYVGVTPLVESLADGVPQADREVMGRPCLVFHFKDIGVRRHQSLVFALDKQTAIPLKVTAYDDAEAITEQRPNWDWEAKSLDVVGGRHFPRLSRNVTYAWTKGKSGEWVSRVTITQEIHVDEIDFDVGIPDAEFWPVFQPGCQILDPHHLAKEVQRPLAARQVPKDPVRVPEAEGGTLWISVAILAASLSLLALAAVIWRRVR